MAYAARTFLKGVVVPSSVVHAGKEYFVTEDEQDDVLFLMAVMTLFATGLENRAPEMTVNVARSQLAEIMHRSVKTVGRRIALAKVLGLLRSTFKGNHSEYVVSQKPGQHDVPAEEVARWAKGRKSGQPEMRNDDAPASDAAKEDALLRNETTEHPAGTPSVPPVVSPLENTEQGHKNGEQGHADSQAGTQKPQSRDNMVSHSGVVPTGSKELSGTNTGPSATPPTSQATEVISSGNGGEHGLSNGLLIKQTHQKHLPECQICRQIAGDFSAGIDPDPKGSFCEKHDNPMYR